MGLSDAQKLEVKRRFRKQSIRCCIFIAVFWLTVLLYKVGADESAGTWFGLTIVVWGPPLAAGTLTGLIGFAVSLRCPSCGAVYGRPIFTKFCGNCGVALR
jgi:hypothetical protein